MINHRLFHDVHHPKHSIQHMCRFARAVSISSQNSRQRNEKTPLLANLFGPKFKATWAIAPLLHEMGGKLRAMEVVVKSVRVPFGHGFSHPQKDSKR